MAEPKICAACNDKEAPVEGWHCCTADGCKKPVHSHVLCDRVWMPRGGCISVACCVGPVVLAVITPVLREVSYFNVITL